MLKRVQHDEKEVGCSRPIADIRRACETRLMTDPEAGNRFLPPGTRVRYDGRDDAIIEYGVIVHCWDNPEIRAFDCYVAVFGSEFPANEPEEKPYVVRYAAISLEVLDAAS